MSEEKAANTDWKEPTGFDQAREAAIRTFFNIAEAWSLSEAEQTRLLGLETSGSLQGCRSGDLTGITRDMLERISNVLGIYRSVHSLLSNPKQADDWIRKPNKSPLFNNGSALERMTAGDISDLRVVRQYLEAECM